MLELKDLTTGYKIRGKDIVISYRLTETFSGGEVVSLLGPNGAGKSTLLKTLSGFLKPIAGEVVINGKPLERYKATDLSRVMAVVLTEKPTTVSMSVTQLVEMGRSPYTGFRGALSAEDHMIVEEAMELVGIGSMKKRRVSTLSDGELQKVMIAKAVAQDTPIILLDEPSAFLDFPSKVELMLMLRKLAKGDKEKLIILSTHDLNVALQLSDRLMLVDKQLGTATGTPEELSGNGLLEKYFKSEAIRLERLEFRINN